MIQVSTGMACADDYCGNVRLIQMSVFVDAATAESLAMVGVVILEYQVLFHVFLF